jgi:acetyl esterase/lipase
MTAHARERRDFLRAMAVGAGALPLLSSVDVWSALAASMPTYDPSAKFDLSVTELEYRKTAAGRSLKARIYQPNGTGPFPAILDLHGGAWNAKDRFAEEPMDRALAASGLLVVAVDLTLAPEAPYPASVQDANYAVRWLKWKAPAWEWRRVEAGHLRQFERRPRCRTSRHAPARSALQRHSIAGGARRGPVRRLHRHPLTDQRSSGAL